MPRRSFAAAVFVVIACLVAASTLLAADEPSPPAPAERIDRDGVEMIDLTRAAVVRGNDPRVLRGASVLAANETSQRFPSGTANAEPRFVRGWPEADGRPVIALGLAEGKLDWTGPFQKRLGDGRGVEGAEGYRIETDPKIPAVLILGNDPRGVMFGLGRLFRELRREGDRVLLPATFRAASAPKNRLRGHQLGYRPKTNSYDAWGRGQWLRYIHELAVFGANAVELVPPRTDDDRESPHFPSPPLEMMEVMSGVCDRYDLDVWVWFPVMDPVDTDPSKVEPLLKEWDEVFQKLPRLDAVFVPGGDPGHIPPGPLFGFLERAAEVLHRRHPKAKMWVSPQGFDAERMDEFLKLAKDGPKWLDGVVFGPQVRMPLAELKKALPETLPIRGYPDITHSRQCQHPVPDWDLAFACTEGREAINPRPRAEAALCRAYRPDTVGFITYSEGCNDDVNKAVWSALGWDPDADVTDVLRQYARYFIGEPYADTFAQGLLGLERNWSGPLLLNEGVETTLRQFQDMERTAPPTVKRNWRFQQALYRAYYDAHVRDRLIQETALEQGARRVLRMAPRLGAGRALDGASAVLDRSLTEPASPDRRARVFELGEALFQSVRMQLSKPKYQAIDPERGANLDTIDTPLNDRVWLGREFARIRALPSEPARLRSIENLLGRTDPGPGGFYDAPGDPANAPHLVREPSPTDDPMLVRAPFVGFALKADWPTPWRRYVQTFHDAPIRFAYDGLDPHARYRVRVTYAGDSPRTRMRLEADGAEVHPLIDKPSPVAPVEFAVPREATADGRLGLTFTQEPGRGGNGRGCQVAEVWLLREAR